MQPPMLHAIFLPSADHAGSMPFSITSDSSPVSGSKTHTPGVSPEEGLFLYAMRPSEDQSGSSCHEE
jgi:hypothetical protein